MSSVRLNNCFKKVSGDNLLGDFDIKNLKTDLHMSHSKWQKFGLSLKNKEDYDAAVARTYEVSDEIKMLVLSKIPKDLLDLETPHVWYLEVTGTNDETTMIPPHIDKFRICTVNYYINTSGETTYYYQYKSGIMEELGSFCANTNECWVLNTTIPHSVKLNVGQTRKVIGVSFLKTPFEKVVSFFD